MRSQTPARDQDYVLSYRSRDTRAGVDQRPYSERAFIDKCAHLAESYSRYLHCKISGTNARIYRYFRSALNAHLRHLRHRIARFQSARLCKQRFLLRSHPPCPRTQSFDDNEREQLPSRDVKLCIINVLRNDANYMCLVISVHELPSLIVLLLPASLSFRLFISNMTLYA